MEFTHTSVFTIKQGKYLSSYACLFVTSLFLYKGEAEQLIRKIKGFKQSDGKLRYKRNIFTFLSKKFKNQDIDSEETNLVQFRDIIQYLNHYPTVWNPYLEPERKCTDMTNLLEKHVIDTEIFRSFVNDNDTFDRNAFLSYTLDTFFPNQKNCSI